MNTAKKIVQFTVSILFSVLFFSSCASIVWGDPLSGYISVNSASVSSDGLWFMPQNGNTEYMAVAYNGKSDSIVIPAYHNDKPVTAIGPGAYAHPAVVGYVPPLFERYLFAGNSNIKSVSFETGSNVTILSTGAFMDCTSLTSVSLPSSIRTIRQDAFKNTGIWDNTSNDSVVYADNWAIGLKGVLSHVQIIPGTVGIAECAFYHTAVASIDIPTSVKTVNGLAFDHSQLANSFPDKAIVYADKWVVGYNGDLGAEQIEAGTVGIADSALRYAKTLTSISIPKSVKSMGEEAFLLAQSLTAVTIEDGLSSIGAYAFLYCRDLETIYIPLSVSSIGIGAFGSCKKLTIYAEAAAMPDGWLDGWNHEDCPVVWATRH
jgi:hypothetical protein